VTSTLRPLVAVTGGAGFIGSHTVDLLVAKGCRVVVLDDFSTGKRANLAASATSIDVLTVDISHGIFAALAPFTATHGPVERIVHLAAQVSVIHSIANPLTDMRVNYGGTLEVLEYARAHAVKKVVFASSAAVYGDVTEFPVDENAVCHPVSPYGTHKLASEHALHYYSQVHGVPTTALRFFNVYGPRQDPSSPYSGVISIFADRANAGRDLTIFGDGEQTRDFVYVGDVVRAVVGAALTDGADRAVMNVGTGSEISVNELARTIVELTGGKSVIKHAESRAGEILRSVARVERAERLLEWKAQTALRDGLAQTLRG
jgi:UDP-glucose 4-epimerase